MTQSTAAAVRRGRSSRLLQIVAAYRQCVVVMHDNPDPDAIAAGWALLVLLRERLGAPVRLVGGGAVMRSENRRMVELLGPPVELVESLDIGPETAAVLVDCSLGAGNQLLTREAVRPVAVIDHHAHGAASSRAPFTDVRPQVAASATIASGYLREQGIEPTRKLATALLYAIHSETDTSEARFSSLDRDVLTWLTARADPELLAAIENAPLARAYYGELVLAMQNAFLYDDAVLCLLPRAEGAEIVGEVAELLVRCEGVRRVLCGAVIGRDILVSVRTQGEQENALALLQATLEGLGRGGGHAHRAGGRIALGDAARSGEELWNELRARWLAACGVDRQRGSRLVAKRDIVENLERR